ncbi:galactose ABC transporter substrate-binding protein [Desulfovibrio sp. OttesenSCG-928-O18]|nr:galactose ABC transporter substrate-binding protein [Desulfovibrio sp. OttesenSCG-928-O18]
MNVFFIRTVPRLALLLLCCVFLVGGCDDKTPPPSKPAGKPLIGVFLYRDDDVYISLVSKAMREAFADRAEVVVHSAGADQLTQNEQIDRMIARNPNGLVVNLVDMQAASFVADKAKKQGIPVLFFNREPDLDSLKAYDKMCFVGTTALDAGKMQGDIIKRLWDEHPEYDRNRDGKFQYIMIQANSDNPEAIARTEYSVRQARERGVPMRQVGETMMCDWDEAEAYRAVSLALASLEGTVELVISNNDTMALGAISALAERGYNRAGGDPAMFIPVIGVDAIPPAVEAIRKGVMSATVKQDDKLMGGTIAALILNAVDGKDFLAGTGLRWDESGVAVRLPYSPFAGGR